MPFAEDEKAFFFPSLTELKSKSGKPITEHRLLPTEEQDSLMHDLVDEMDLDDFADPDTGE
jgi:ATP-dependent DNA helicase 2 subunit 2